MDVTSSESPNEMAIETRQKSDRAIPLPNAVPQVRSNVGFVVSKEDLGSDQELGLITQSFCVTEVLLDEKGQRKLLT